MDYTILLYGATGYTGRLIAEEARSQSMSTPRARPAFQLILAARDGPSLKLLANANHMEYRVFGLDDRDDIVANLGDVDVVLNAAGPFAWTAERLCKAALQQGCHYVDINGEVDVYNKLDDLDWQARQRSLAVVCSAGHSAAASDHLLEQALLKLLAEGTVKKNDSLGSVRIAMSRIDNFSRGSAETLARSMREQVVVARRAQPLPRRPSEGLVLWHEPVGKLERQFDFRDRSRTSDADMRIASAANLVDTLTARLTVLRHQLTAGCIESYVEMNAAARIGYQLSAVLAPMMAVPWVRKVVQAAASTVPKFPTEPELEREGHIVVLEIDDANGSPVIRWRGETPNVYRDSAKLAYAVAAGVATGKHVGWCTPAEVLLPKGSTGEQ